MIRPPTCTFSYAPPRMTPLRPLAVSRTSSGWTRVTVPATMSPTAKDDVVTSPWAGIDGETSGRWSIGDGEDAAEAARVGAAEPGVPPAGGSAPPHAPSARPRPRTV